MSKLKPELMSVPDFDDIIFERLNKEYGAYLLRKKYNNAVIVSVVAACILGSAMVIIPFLSIPGNNNNKIYNIVQLSMENLEAPGNQVFNPPPPPSSIPPKVPGAVRSLSEETKYIAPVVVDTVITYQKKMNSASDSLSGDMTDEGITDGSGDGSGVISGTGGGGGSGGNGIYSAVEVMPKFKGGDINKFREWVQRKTRYPEEATINNIQGKVYISFIVEKDGTVTNVKLVRGIDRLINEEALKAVSSSPRWTPGRQRGVAVRVSYLIMVNFRL